MIGCLTACSERFKNQLLLSQLSHYPSYDIDGSMYGFTLYIAIKARPTRTERMKLLAEQMSQTHQKMQQLEYETFVLSKQGKQEESFRKTKAVRMAKEHWLKLNREYKRLWKAEQPIESIGHRKKYE